MTLTEFLLARIAEDEAAAKAATPGPWRWRDPYLGRVRQALVGARDQMVVPSANGDVYPSWMDADHIARWDPARVLAECDAKRRIVVAFQQAEAADQSAPTSGLLFGRAYRDGRVGALRGALYSLASTYADHPDYDEAWRP